MLLGPGDVVILPAGTGHEALSATKDLLVVGAYPPSGKYDEYQDKRAQYEKALRMIPRVKLPSKDPVFGKNGPLKRLWVKKAPHAVTAAEVANMVRCGSPYDRSAPASALFKVGDKVRAKNMHPKTHTRLPRYARGHLGQIVRIVGCHVFPDANASNLGEAPHWLYTVRFHGRELWGNDSDPTVRVCIEAWEPYLEKA